MKAYQTDLRRAKIWRGREENTADVRQLAVWYCKVCDEYFDLKEASNFILYCENNNLIKSTAKIERNFESINDITMSSIKLHYLKVLENISTTSWDSVYLAMKNLQEKRIKPNEGIDAKGNIIFKS